MLLWLTDELVAFQSGGEGRFRVFAEHLPNAPQPDFAARAWRRRESNHIFDRVADRNPVVRGEQNSTGTHVLGFA